VPHDRHREHRENHVDRRAVRHEERASRRERRHTETRDEILVAAREVLLERGATDLSLREIARRAGFSPAALYKYFDSKDDVIGALADAAMGALLTAFAQVPADLTPDERALELGMAYLAFARENPEDVAVIELHESATHALPLSAEHQAMQEAVMGVFRDGVDHGVFASAGEQDADLMAYGAWAFVQGLSRFERLQPPPIADPFRSRQRELLCAFVNGLKTDWSQQG
jgi:AcrR family transcriptional regulator